jgi:hypothetical protein
VATKRNPGPKAAPGETRERVRELRSDGLSIAAIAAHLSVNKSTVVYHLRGIGDPMDSRFAVRYDWAEIQRAYDEGRTVRECAQQFGFNPSSWSQAVLRGDIVPRAARIPIEEMLVAGRSVSRAYLKKRLIEEGLKENRCEQCGIAEWRGRPLSMQLHHKNGDPLDNRLENLELLCANCHCQTDNFAGRNRSRRSVGNDVALGLEVP